MTDAGPVALVRALTRAISEVDALIERRAGALAEEQVRQARAEGAEWKEIAQRRGRQLDEGQRVHGGCTALTSRWRARAQALPYGKRSIRPIRAAIERCESELSQLIVSGGKLIAPGIAPGDDTTREDRE